MIWARGAEVKRQTKQREVGCSGWGFSNRNRENRSSSGARENRWEPESWTYPSVECINLPFLFDLSFSFPLLRIWVVHNVTAEEKNQSEGELEIIYPFFGENCNKEQFLEGPVNDTPVLSHVGVIVRCVWPRLASPVSQIIITLFFM